MTDPRVEPPPFTATGAWGTVLAWGRMIRLSHTVFGLPFALASTALAHRFARQHGDPGLDAWRLVLIVLAFTAARATAMGWNRVVDRHIDAANPRTAARELPRGVIGVRAATTMTVISAAVFVLTAAALGPVPALLSPLCLVLVCGYSYFKRFSWLSHAVLGVALSLAPGGAWVAVTGGFAGAAIPLLLMVAVATWVAGFDVLYSLSDLEFDRAHGLHSIPARFGVVRSLVLSGVSHAFTVTALVLLHLRAGLGLGHAIGVVLVLAILVGEHWIVRPNDLSRLGRAFFDLNGYVSLAYLVCTLVDVW